MLFFMAIYERQFICISLLGLWILKDLIMCVIYNSKTDSSLFIYHRGSDIAYLLLYADDIILKLSSSSFLQRVIAMVHGEFNMTDLGSLKYFLGISAQRSSAGLFLSQSTYAKELLERAHMQKCNQCRTPMDTESKLGADGDPVCLYMHDLWEPHLAALKHVLRYVYGDRVDNESKLGADGDPVRSTETTLAALKHVLRYMHVVLVSRDLPMDCVFLGENLLSWYAKRQVTLSRSSVEAEYRGVPTVVLRPWVCNLLRELHAPLFTTTLVYYDNVSVVYLSINPVQHQRTKNIETGIHFVCDFMASEQVHVLHVPLRFQYTFTKGLPSALFLEFCSSLNVQNLPFQLHGCISRTY
ncbi:ribonuclease H-like domain-containing protein [Tanacetum coccineum]|uniref:Ribonuclease H-like domain-containing protein n=1 Tax=Tanacetum coccineum TaxID=301880 RepID=A0ABQ5FV31_9ASTR